MNSQLILTEWKKQIANPVEKGDPDIATVVQKHEKVFIYKKDESTHCDKANISIILKRFGKSQIYKKNLMANNHMEAVDLVKPLRNNKPTLNEQRVKKIKEVDDEYADFFLRNLMFLTWKDYKKGIQTTIPFDEAFEMLKLATKAYYDLKIAFVEDTFNKDLSLSEMKNVIDVHNLNNEYALGKR